MSASNAILVAAAPTLHRYGLLATLTATWPDLTIDTTTDAHTLPALARRRPYILVVVDGQLPGLLPEQLLPLRPWVPVLLLAGPRLPAATRQRLLRAEVCSLLPRHTTPAHVVQAVTTLLSEARPARPAPVAAVRRPTAPATAFSRRELEVLQLVVADCCNQEIADQLFLSVRTVESHRRALLQKTGARSVLGLAVQAVRAGWVADSTGGTCKPTDRVKS